MTRAGGAILWALAVVVWPGPASAQIPAGSLAIVLPFDNLSNEPRLAWLREGAAVLTTDLLTGAGATTVSRAERQWAFDRLQLPGGAALSRASSIRVGQAVGATIVVLGGVEVSGDQVLAQARVVSLDTGRLLPGVESRGPLTDVFGVFRRLVEQLGVVGTPVSVADRIPSSPQVFETYVKGLLAETPATALAFLGQTLAAAPGFDRARMAIWEIETEAGNHEHALAAVSAIDGASRLSRTGRFRKALSLMTLQRHEEALQTLRALQAEERSASVANALGVAELRRATIPQAGRATYYFSQATEINPADGDLFFNLGYAYWLDGDPAAAIYWLRETVRRQPGDGDAHYVLSVALQRTGATAEGARERELAARLSSKYTGWDAKAPGGDPVPKGLERLDSELRPFAARIDSVITSAGIRDHQALAAFHLDAGRRAYEREADREAIRELRRALYLSPYLAEAHRILGRLYLRGGRQEDAVAALKIALWSEETVEAHIALAEAYLQAQDTASAQTEVDRALELDPSSEAAADLKVRIDGSPC